jgi:hypothetical protein
MTIVVGHFIRSIKKKNRLNSLLLKKITFAENLTMCIKYNNIDTLKVSCIHE